MSADILLFLLLLFMKNVHIDQSVMQGKESMYLYVEGTGYTIAAVTPVQKMEANYKTMYPFGQSIAQQTFHLLSFHFF